jgi:hypothetical protein
MAAEPRVAFRTLASYKAHFLSAKAVFCYKGSLPVIWQFAFFRKYSCEAAVGGYCWYKGGIQPVTVWYAAPKRRPRGHPFCHDFCRLCLTVSVIWHYSCEVAVIVKEAFCVTNILPSSMDEGRFVTIFAGYYFHSPGGASILCQKSRQNASVFVVFLPRVATRGYKYLATSELLRSPPRRTREVYGSLLFSGITAAGQPLGLLLKGSVLPVVWHAAKKSVRNTKLRTPSKRKTSPH